MLLRLLLGVVMRLLEGLAVDGQLLIRRHRGPQRLAIHFIRSIIESGRNQWLIRFRSLLANIFDHFLLESRAEYSLEDRIGNIRLILFGVFGRRDQNHLVAKRHALLFTLSVTRSSLAIQNSGGSRRW